MSNPTDELIAALTWYDQAKRAADQASYRHWQVEQDHEKIKAEINTAVWSDKTYTNDTLRKAEATRRLDCTALLDAEAEKTAMAADLARAEQALKTHRALVNHYTAELTLEAARLQASIAAEPVRPAPQPVEQYAPPARQPIPFPQSSPTAPLTPAARVVQLYDDDLPF